MTGFDERKDAFENKYAHDEKLNFDTEARCCKLFGLWAAEKLGISGPDADTYAKEVVMSNLEEPGFEDVFRKVRADFEEKGIEINDHQMRTEMDKALVEAKKQLG
ncbi:MAG: DUF1476 domain-containing protein [Alphaproteobacteria bacterium]